MKLRFDPSDLDTFKTQIRGIPGYPVGEELPIREMVFESGALWRLSDLLLRAGIRRDQLLFVVMDQTPIQQEFKNITMFILGILANAGWQKEFPPCRPDGT